MQTLKNIVRALSLPEGCSGTNFPGLTLYRYTDRKITMPDLHNPYIYLVLDGGIRLHTPSGIMDYMAGQYSVSAIDTPLSGYILTYSSQMDFLAAALEFTLNDVISVVIDLEESLTEQITNARLEEDFMKKADAHVLETAARLLSAVNESTQLAFIGRQLQREIIFYIL